MTLKALNVKGKDFSVTSVYSVVSVLFFIFFGLISLINSKEMSYSGLRKEVVLYGNNTAGPYNLSARFILTGSDSIFIADSFIGKDRYQIDYDQGTIVFSTVLPELTQVNAKYQRIPFLDLSSSYFQHRKETEAISESVAAGFSLRSRENERNLKVAATDSGVSPNFEDLSVTGSKTLGFSVGSEQGLGIEQATRLNLQGTVSGFEIEAALSDQNSPIPPEGATKEISELDKILINVRKGGWSGSFGDYDLTMPFGSLGTVERKATGAMVIGNLDKTKIHASYSRPKGKFRKIILSGEDGIQGPYRLTAGESFMTIVPASEIVYLDGEQLTRGWNEDYTIDYSLTEITFTNKRTITKQSRIEVNFEYTFDAYDRYALGIGVNYQLTPFSFGVKNFQESDNQNQSLAYNLSNADIESLSVIGDDTSRTWLDGGSYVGNGHGNYNRFGAYYVYAGRDSGEYDVTFTFVGDSIGDYVYDDSIYFYVGSNRGRYVAKRHIILPQKNEIYLTELGLKMENGLSLDLAGSMSRNDRNLFSVIDDANNTGFAYTTNFSFQKSNYGIIYQRKATPSNFSNPIRSSDIDFSYNWGDVREEERLSTDEVQGFIKPFHFFSVDAGTGWLLNRNQETQQRFNFGSKFFWAGYEMSKIQRILRQNLSLSPQIRFVHPLFYLFKEDRENSRRLTWNPALGVKPSEKWQATVSFDQTQEEKQDTSNLAWRKESIRRMYKIDLSLKPFSTIELQGILGWQVLEALPGTASGSWTQYFADITGAYSLTKGITFRIDHHRANQQTQQQQERYIQVDSGSGNYKRDPETGTFYPDTNGNYKRILEPTGAISRSQEQEWHGSIDISIFGPLDLNTLINFNQEGNDTFSFFRVYNHDVRLGIFPFLQNKNISIYLENNYNYNLDYRYIDQKDWQNRNSVEFQAAPTPNFNLEAGFEFNLSQKEQNSSFIFHKESERKFILEPFIGYNLALELFTSLSWRNIDYSNYNNFQLITANFGIKRRWQFQKNTALTTQAIIIRRTANAKKLPFEIVLSEPLGVTPEFNLSLDQIISKELIFSASYHFQNRPDRTAEQNLSANLRAYF
jgi:hypothetical protein